MIHLHLLAALCGSVAIGILFFLFGRAHQSDIRESAIDECIQIIKDSSLFNENQVITKLEQLKHQ